MHVCGRLSDLPAEPGRFSGHSERLVRRVLVDSSCGSPHQEVAVVELGAGGSVDRHLNAFEQVLYVLRGHVTLDVAGTREELGADDYVFIDRGVAHSLRNESGAPAEWFEVSAPQPGARLQDTVFVAGGGPRPDAEPPYRKWHFDESDLPAPSGSIGLAGFGGGNVGGAALKVLVGPETGASQLVLMLLHYAPGGFIVKHDHAFEESFFFLAGEIEAELDGETYTLRAGDYCWSGVGGMHALTNRTDQPVRWLETQAPQPPSRYQARFVGDWERFVGGG
jgi:quercetin dioxygenase-like cupin family protein